MTSPITLLLPNDAPLVFGTAFNSSVCDGNYYLMTLDYDQDYIIRMAPSAPALLYPLAINGGANIRIVGLAIDLLVDATHNPACRPGQVNPFANTGAPNVRPITPIARALSLRQAKVTYVEGASIKMNGIESDCITGANRTTLTVDQAFSQRDYVFEASQCRDYTGDASNNGIHADLFQQQNFNLSSGEGVTRNLIFENFSNYNGQTGIIHEGNNAQYSYGVIKLVIRNANFAPSTVVPPASACLSGCPQFNVATPTSSSTDMMLTNYWVDQYQVPKCWNTGGYGSWPFSFDCNFNFSPPNINSGIPPGGDFAPLGQIGLNYVSPFDGPATLTASAAIVPGGVPVTATWSGVPAPTVTDWIGVYVPGTVPTAFGNFVYTSSCTTTPGVTAAAAGNCKIVVAAAKGTYELRLNPNDLFTTIAVSSAIDVFWRGVVLVK